MVATNLRWLSITAASQRTKVSEHHLLRAAINGQIHAYDDGDMTWISLTSLRAWLERQTDLTRLAARNAARKRAAVGIAAFGLLVGMAWAAHALTDGTSLGSKARRERGAGAVIHLASVSLPVPILTAPAVVRSRASVQKSVLIVHDVIVVHNSSPADVTKSDIYQQHSQPPQSTQLTETKGTSVTAPDSSANEQNVPRKYRPFPPEPRPSDDVRFPADGDRAGAERL